MGGDAVLSWMVPMTLAAIAPDTGVTASIATRTLLWTAVLGVLTVALAPVRTARRLRRMDIPARLRGVE